MIGFLHYFSLYRSIRGQGRDIVPFIGALLEGFNHGLDGEGRDELVECFLCGLW